MDPIPALNRILLMSMRMLILIFALLVAASASAECIGPQHPCEAWSRSNAVWIGTVQQATPGEVIEDLGPVSYLVRMVADEVFYGKLEAGSIVEFEQLAIGEFGARPEVGTRYFVYSSNQDGSGLSLGVCTGTTRLEWARADLDFARGLETVPPPRSFRGVVSDVAQGRSNAGALEGAQVTLTGLSGRFETESDERGVFVFEGIPEGRYRIASRYPGYRGYAIPEVVVPETGCGFSDVHLFPATGLSGQVVGPAGRPVAGISVEAMPLAPLSRGRLVGGSARTDLSGRFAISGLPAGQYRIGVNLSMGPGDRSQNAATFYPGTTDWRQAAILTLGPTDTLDNLDFALGAPLSSTTIRGRVMRSDGEPVEKARVAAFDPRYHDREYRHFSEVVQTDAEGRFSLRVFEGIQYVLEASRHVQDRGNQCAESVPLELDPSEHDPEYMLVLTLDDAGCKRQWAQFEDGPTRSLAPTDSSKTRH